MFRLRQSTADLTSRRSTDPAHLVLSLLPEEFAVCRLSPDEELAEWMMSGALYSITRSPEETSVICRAGDVPVHVRTQNGWRALKVDGPLDLSQSGVLAALTAPLAEAGISIFALSTYDTDYVLVREELFSQAVSVLAEQGHLVRL